MKRSWAECLRQGRSLQYLKSMLLHLRLVKESSRQHEQEAKV